MCLDNFSTKHRKNIGPFLSNSRFTLIRGDIRLINDCLKKNSGDVPHSHASIDKAKALLDYKSQFSLEKGLKKSLG